MITTHYKVTGMTCGHCVKTVTGALKKLDAQAAGFEVAVPAGGQTQLRYTVRYRWAPDVRLP